jgi:hypothetical protein
VLVIVRHLRKATIVLRRTFALILALLFVTSSTVFAIPSINEVALSARVYLPIVSQRPTSLVALNSSLQRISERPDYAVVGELYNGTASPLYVPRVRVISYDDQNRKVSDNMTYTFFGRIDPGQTLPFDMFVPLPPTTPVRYELQPAGSSDFPGQAFEAVTVVSQDVRSNSTPEIVGILRNDSMRFLESVRVVSTFYDAQGVVVGIADGFADGRNVAPGATTTYSLTAQRSFVYASFVVQAQGSYTP